jgi:hypothetical protein
MMLSRFRILRDLIYPEAFLQDKQAALFGMT